MEEIWKDIHIKEVEGMYKVSNKGRVMSLKYGKERILKPRITHFGYLIVALQHLNYRKECKVHRLVGMEFLGLDTKNNNVIGHKDNNVKNNSLNNLYVTTQLENQNYKVECGRSVKGEKHWKSKLSNNQILQIYSLYKKGTSLKKISEIFSHKGISEIIKGKNWRHLYHNF